MRARVLLCVLCACLPLVAAAASLQPEGGGFRAAFTVASGGESAWYHIPPGSYPVTVSVMPQSGATGTLKFTTSGAAAVDAGTATEQTQSSSIAEGAAPVVFDGPVSAVRVGAAAAAVDVEILAPPARR